MKLNKLSYNDKRKIILTSIAIISFIIVILSCIAVVFMIYNEALLSSKSTQLKKAEKYAQLVEDTEKEGVVFVGDSIFEMYDLDKYYKNKGYINRGISSNKSEDVLNRLQTNVIDLNPRVVIIHVGTNDIGHNVPSDKYISNMDKIISTLQTALPNCKILVDSIYPTVTLNSYNSKNLTKVRDNTTILNVNEKLINLCRTKNVTYINTHFILFADGALYKTYTLDGLHLSDVGYKMVTHEIAKYID